MFPKYKGDSYGPFVFEEAKFLARNGIEVHVITQHNSGANYEEERNGIHIHRFRWLKPKTFKALIYFKGFKDNFRLLTYLISLFFNLIILVRRYDIDVIHAHHTIPTGFVGVIIAKIMRRPIVITAHLMDITTHGADVGPLENIKDFESNFIFRRLIIFTLNSSNKIIAVSADLANKIELMGIDNKKISILRNAVDVNKFKPLKNTELRNNFNISEEDILILFIGHLEAFKGIYELIDAFCKVKGKINNLKLMIIGEGHEEQKVKEKVSELELDNFIIFTGKISPEVIQNFYQMADIFVLPSYTEGLPLVVIEAMACGLPVIVSNVGGIPEIVRDGENGFIIQPKERGKLAIKLEILANDPNLREKYGKKSIQIIDDEFNIENKIIRFTDLYNELKDSYK
jgi:N-acetyl-alpha-D-glucosaminyl L-malate synthase BshA